MFKKKTIVGAAILAVMLAACSQGGQSGQSASTSAPPSAQGSVGGIRAAAFGNATISGSGDTYSATRSGTGSQGVSISQGPDLVTFTTQGPSIRVKAHVGDDWINLPRAEQYAVMIGQGGAYSVAAYTQDGQTVQVHIVSIQSCDTAPAGACTPPKATPAAPAAHTP
jgi:hypothetical protein